MCLKSFPTVALVKKMFPRSVVVIRRTRIFIEILADLLYRYFLTIDSNLLLPYATYWCFRIVSTPCT